MTPEEKIKNHNAMKEREEHNAKDKKEREDKKVSDMAIEAASIKEEVKTIVKDIREALESKSSINVKSIVSNIAKLGKLVNKEFASKGKKGTALLADDFMDLGVELQSQNKEDFPALKVNNFAVNQFLEDIRLKHEEFFGVFGYLAIGKGLKNEDLTQSELDSFKKGYYILCPLLSYKYDSNMENETTNNEPKTILQSIIGFVVSVYKEITSLFFKASEPSLSSQDEAVFIENNSAEELASPLYDSLYETLILVGDTQRISQTIHNLPEQSWWERLIGSPDPNSPFKELLDNFESFDISGDSFEELFMAEVKKQLEKSDIKGSKDSGILKAYTEVGNNRMICESIKKLLSTHLENPHSSDRQFKELLDKHNSMSISADEYVAQFVTLVKDNQADMNKDSSYEPILASFEALNKEGADMSSKETEVRLNSDTTNPSQFIGLFETLKEPQAKVGEEEIARSSVNPMHQEPDKPNSNSFNSDTSTPEKLGSIGFFSSTKTSGKSLAKQASQGGKELERQHSTSSTKGAG